jgi:hypothetical protein
MKNINEVVDTYRFIDFKDGVVGSSKPSKDSINTELLKDINTAAERAGVKVDVTTAVSGHRTKTSSGNVSRHSTGNAVDISIINGKSVRTIDKNIIDRFVNELVKMGYVRGKESGNPKAILDYKFKGGGHEGHIHISNTGGSSSNIENNDEDSPTETPDDFLSKITNNIKDTDSTSSSFIEPQFNFIDYAFGNKLNEEITRIKELL